MLNTNLIAKQTCCCTEPLCIGDIEADDGIVQNAQVVSPKVVLDFPSTLDLSWLASHDTTGTITGWDDDGTGQALGTTAAAGVFNYCGPTVAANRLVLELDNCDFQWGAVEPYGLSAGDILTGVSSGGYGIEAIYRMPTRCSIRPTVKIIWGVYVDALGTSQDVTYFNSCQVDFMLRFTLSAPSSQASGYYMSLNAMTIGTLNEVNVPYTFEQVETVAFIEDVIAARPNLPFTYDAFYWNRDNGIDSDGWAAVHGALPVSIDPAACSSFDISSEDICTDQQSNTVYTFDVFAADSNEPTTTSPNNVQLVYHNPANYSASNCGLTCSYVCDTGSAIADIFPNQLEVVYPTTIDLSWYATCRPVTGAAGTMTIRDRFLPYQDSTVWLADCPTASIGPCPDRLFPFSLASYPQFFDFQTINNNASRCFRLIYRVGNEIEPSCGEHQIRLYCGWVRPNTTFGETRAIPFSALTLGIWWAGAGSSSFIEYFGAVHVGEVFNYANLNDAPDIWQWAEADSVNFTPRFDFSLLYFNWFGGASCAGYSVDPDAYSVSEFGLDGLPLASFDGTQDLSAYSATQQTFEAVELSSSAPNLVYEFFNNPTAGLLTTSIPSGFCAFPYRAESWVGYCDDNAPSQSGQPCA